MTDRDEDLAGLWALDEPAAYDPLFQIAAMARIERRRIIDQLVRVVAMGALGGVTLWAGWPGFAAVTREIVSALPVAGPVLISVAAVTIAGMAWFGRRVEEI